MIVNKFIKELSWFPTEGKLDDLFNHNFKLVIKVYDEEDPNKKHKIPVGTVGVALMWKGNIYKFATNTTEAETPAQATIKWTKPPTIREFLEALGEPIPEETTVYSYSWLAIVKVNQNGELDPNGKWACTDKWDAQLLVKVPAFDVNKILMYAGIGLVGLGVLTLLGRERAYEYAKRAYEYAKKAPEFIKERV